MSGLRKAAEKILDLCSQDRDLSPDMLEAKLAELGLTVAQPLARERAREAYVKARCSEMETYQDARSIGISPQTAYDDSYNAAANRLRELLGPVPTRKVTRAEASSILSKCLAESGMAFNASDNEMKWTATQVARRLGLEVADE